MPRAVALVAAGTALVAATYGLVRLAYGLLLPDLQAELGFDAAVAGAISAGASVVYALGAAVGFVAARGRARALVVLAGASAGIGAIGMAGAVGTSGFAASAVVASAGAGLASPALVDILRRRIVPVARDRAQLVVNAGTGPGLVAAGVLALLVLPDWRAAWAVAALVTVVAAALVVALDRPADAPRREATAPAGRTATRARELLPPRRWVAAHGRLIVAALLMGAGSAAIWTYGRVLVVEAGADESASTTAWIAIGVGGAAVIATAAAMSAVRPATAYAATSLVVAATTVALVAVPASTPVVLLACAGFGWGYTAGTGALIAWTSRLDPDRAAAGTALLFVVLILGQAAGAAVAGVLGATAGFGTAFAVAAGASALAAVLALAPSTVRG